MVFKPYYLNLGNRDGQNGQLSKHYSASYLCWRDCGGTPQRDLGSTTTTLIRGKSHAHCHRVQR